MLSYEIIASSYLSLTLSAALTPITCHPFNAFQDSVTVQSKTLPQLPKLKTI